MLHLHGEPKGMHCMVARNGHGAWMQVEEAYIGAEQFCRRLKQDEESVLNTEALVLSGLKFDLITYSPFTSLSGYFMVCITHKHPLHSLPLQLLGMQALQIKFAVSQVHVS